MDRRSHYRVQVRWKYVDLLHAVIPADGMIFFFFSQHGFSHWEMDMCQWSTRSRRFVTHGPCERSWGTEALRPETGR